MRGGRGRKSCSASAFSPPRIRWCAGMRKESPYSSLWCSSARKGPRIRSARVSQMARLAHDGVLASIEMRIYNIQDYNNNYGMKAARRRYLIYINEDEEIMQVLNSAHKMSSLVCRFRRRLHVVLAPVKSCYYRIRVVVDWEFNAASLSLFACFLCSVQEPDREEKTRTSDKNHRVLRHGRIHACVESGELNLHMRMQFLFVYKIMDLYIDCP